MTRYCKPRGAPVVGLRWGCSGWLQRGTNMENRLACRLLLTMAVTAAALCGSVAQASVNGDTISIAFGRDEPSGTPGCMLDPTDVAGAPGYASANWNNTVGGANTLAGLVRDTNGVAVA